MLRLHFARWLTAPALGAFLALATTARAEGELRFVRADDRSASSAAVVVGGSESLVVTGQIFPGRGDGSAATGDAREQSVSVLDRLDRALAAAGTSQEGLVKLNVYTQTDADAVAFREAFAQRAAGKSARPAIAFVAGALAAPGAVVAVDAVARVSRGGFDGPVRLLNDGLAMVSPGPKVFVSGQAEPGDFLTATRATLEKLRQTLEFLGSGMQHVAQVKAFFQPITAADDVRREVAKVFGPGPIPPLVLVEWRMPGPIEIELIAAATPAGTPATATPEPLTFLTPPGLKPSPIFSRVARVERGPLIFIGGLYGQPGSSGSAQTEAVFDSLKAIAAEAGSDFGHLVKATYYVSDDPASKALNDLRPRYYDPARPPAASKASVAGVGSPGCTLTLDMIAVPAVKKP
jgi:enamine deaminase RidA (YjgF/YER057c/UK114 family)